MAKFLKRLNMHICKWTDIDIFYAVGRHSYMNPLTENFTHRSLENHQIGLFNQNRFYLKNPQGGAFLKKQFFYVRELAY